MTANPTPQGISALLREAGFAAAGRYRDDEGYRAALREEIQQERTHHDLAAAEFAGRGQVVEEARRYARVNALDWVLAAMDRLEADR